MERLNRSGVYNGLKISEFFAPKYGIYFEGIDQENENFYIQCCIKIFQSSNKLPFSNEKCSILRMAKQIPC